jgi:hypothetical protein
MMTLDTAAQVVLYIDLFFVAMISLVVVGLLAGLVIGLNKLNEKIDLALEQARPVIAKTTDVLDTVQRVTMNVGERADQILSQGEELTAKISTKVDHTASVVEKTVTSPLINLSSVLAGVTRGFGKFNRSVHDGDSGGTHTNGTG